MRPAAPLDAPFAPGGRGLRAVLASRRDPLAFLGRGIRVKLVPAALAGA